MNSKIKNAVKRGVSGTLAALVGFSTMATSVSATMSGISIGYTWDSTVNPTIYTKKVRQFQRRVGAVCKIRRAVMPFCSLIGQRLGALYRAGKEYAGYALRYMMHSVRIHRV